MKWSRFDEVLLRMFCTVVRVSFRLLPKEWRYLPMVREWRAQRAQADKGGAPNNA